MTARSSRRLEVGFTLLEVLVAVIVLSFGLLGMVGLQAASLKANREALLQAAGARFAAELGDMMRNNRTISALTTGVTANPYIQSRTFGSTDTVAPASPDCFATACTSPLQTAQADIADWLNRVNTALPGARVVVCFDVTPFNSAGLAQWGCSNTGGVVNIKIGWTRGSTNRAAIGSAALELATDNTKPPLVILPVAVGTN